MEISNKIPFDVSSKGLSGAVLSCSSASRAEQLKDLKTRHRLGETGL